MLVASNQPHQGLSYTRTKANWIIHFHAIKCTHIVFAKISLTSDAICLLTECYTQPRIQI